MPQSKKAIQVPVEIVTRLKNQKDTIQKFVSEFDSRAADMGIDLSSTLGKKMVKAFTQAGSKLNFAEALLGKEFFSESDLNKVLGIFNAISDVYAEIGVHASKTKNYSTLGLEDETEKIKALVLEYKELEKAKTNQKNLKLQNIASDSAKPSNKQLEELYKNKDITKFSTAKNYSSNIRDMNAALEEQRSIYQNLNDEAAELENRLASSRQPAKEVAEKIRAIGYKGTKQEQLQKYKDLIDTDIFDEKTGTFKNKEGAKVLSAWLGIDTSTLNFNHEAAKIVAEMRRALEAALTGNSASKRYQDAWWVNSKTLLSKNATEEQREEIYQKSFIEGELEDYNANLNTLKAKQENVIKTKELTSSIEKQIQTLAALKAAHEMEIDATYEDLLKNKKGEIDKLAQAREAEFLRRKEMLQSPDISAESAQTLREFSDNKNLQLEADRRAQEAENFKENLKQSVRHWMSAQQIINIVKDGIRQAVQDIKGLDSAMSNIAVVTDMSISDLWGKINDYMAIAQQYGVTTQGVYEVSQLYYQQGLATAEVMELTTETLKLARVANMDYKDSADAMTVALRGFKMEMSEAATVTDVYSKVAAVTASDQAELAIAMSKTASSAASVGSSFENTTAMLAVMVETTRESAQNLGSALKSIISRYGEMKSGLTQDSEGEIIDYNKVDTALRSIGISIKDAQGQFRDFDDVIFELSEAWGGLDKNTQRYIATIMAGNRQQSRFIALVDNYERLKEVQAAADNSEDAGLLQYAKTLDSLETKMNNIKTSFQQFYMSIFNGEDFKNILDIINNVIKSLNRVGPLLGSLNILNLINQIKMVGQLLINSFSNGLSKIHKSRQEWQDAFTGGWEGTGIKIGQKIVNGISKALRLSKRNVDSTTVAGDALNFGKKLSKDNRFFAYGTAIEHYEEEAKALRNKKNKSQIETTYLAELENGLAIFKEGMTEAAQKAGLELLDGAEKAKKLAEQGADQEKQLEKQSAIEEGQLEKQSALEKGQGNGKTAFNIGRIAYMAGTLLQSSALMMEQDTIEKYDTSTRRGLAGSLATATGQALTKDVPGAIITLVTGFATAIKRSIEREKVNLELLEKKSEEANITRAEKNERAQGLSQAITNLSKLEKARNDSQEAEDAFIEASKAAAEKFPELVSHYDEAGNAIIEGIENSVDAEYLLINARLEAADAAVKAAAAEVNAAEANKKSTEKQADAYKELLTDNSFEGESYKSTAGIIIDDLNGYINGTDALKWAEENQGASDADFVRYIRGLINKIENPTDKADAETIFKNSLWSNSGTEIAEEEFTIDKFLAEAGLLYSKDNAADIRVQASRSAYIQNAATDFLTQRDPLSGLGWREELNNGYETFIKMARSSFVINDSYFDNEGKLKESEVLEAAYLEFDKLLENFGEFWGTGLTTTQQALFDDFIDNYQNYNYNEVVNEVLPALKLNQDEGLGSELLSLWAEQSANIYDRLFEAFEIDGLNQREGFEGGDVAWIQDSIQQLSNQDNSIATILATKELSQLQDYLDFVNQQNSIIEHGNEGAKAAAVARTQEVEKALVALSQGEGEIFGINIADLTKEEKILLESLLVADNAGTFEWADKLVQDFDASREQLNNLVYEFLNTQLNTINESVDNFISEIENVSSKNESGFSMEEAQKYSSLIGKDLWDTFKIENGLIVLNDLNDYIDEYYANLQNKNLKLIEQTQSAISNLDFLNNDHAEGIIQSLKSLGQSDEITKLLSGIGLSGAALDEATNYIINTTDWTIKGLIALLEEIGQNAQNSLQYTEAGAMQAKGKAFLDGLNNTIADVDKALDFKEFYKFSAQDMKDQFVYDITSVSDSIARLPAEYAELISDMEMDATERAQAISDYRNALSSSATNLLQGTGSWQEAARLQAIAGKQGRLQFRETADGIQLLNTSLGELLLTFQSDNSALYAQTYLEIAENIQTYYPELKDVFDIQKKISDLETKTRKETNEALEEELRLLRTAERYASNTANAMSFDFMSTSLSGNRENALSYFGARDTAKESITGLYNEGTIDTGNFMRIFQFLETMGKTPDGWDWTDIDTIASTSEDGVVKLETILAQLEMSSDQFFETLLGNLDKADEAFLSEQYKLQEQTKKSSEFLSKYSKKGITKENLQEFGGEIRIGKDLIDLKNATDDQIDIIQKYLQNATEAELEAWANNGLIDIQENEIPTDVKTIATTLDGIAADVKKIAGPEEIAGSQETTGSEQGGTSGSQEQALAEAEKTAKEKEEEEKDRIATQDRIRQIHEDAIAGASTDAAKAARDFLSHDPNGLSNPIAAEMAIAKQQHDATVDAVAKAIEAKKDEIGREYFIDEAELSIQNASISLNGASTQDTLNSFIGEYNKWALDPNYTPNEDIISEDQLNSLVDWFNILDIQIDQSQDKALILDEIFSKIADYANTDGGVNTFFTLWKEKLTEIFGTPQTLDIEADTKPATDEIKKELDGKTVTVNVALAYGIGAPIAEMWTGNVNGLALAEGTIDKLTQGASLANKTLVGELGPELAVYNGQYHMLGQNGAEFVNLPSNAIVFNHKQTEGIVNGQMGIRGKALSDGTVGPALSGATGAPNVWLDHGYYLQVRDDLLGSGKKGGTKKIERTDVDESEEWYNYLRRIAKLEQEINQLEAERENIMDGGAYLRNLREVQTIYQEQLIIQQQLLEYQKAQLELEQKQIQEKWGDALKFTNEGLLEYTYGNEANGGKGIFELQQDMAEMNGNQQLALIKEFFPDYKPIDKDTGKALQGADLVAKFQEEFFGDIEHYNDLYDSVADTTTGLEDLKKAIKDAEDEIRDNRIELEEKIYDLVVEGWENNIEKMEEELDILSEANERYINGLSEALEKEKSLYDKNEATADREQLQRRLSLLRRSGGSASEIASLEEQLNDTLKDEYFQHQQEAIDKVAEASQTQIEKMEEQIQIQKDQLEFSKEHGLIWEDVNRILSGSTSEILEFIQGNDSTFIEKSATEIGKQLEEWSKKVGIFTEDRQTQEYTKEAIKNFNADALNSSVFNKASADQKKAYTDMFASYFTNARMDGKSADEAYAHAYAELRKTLGEGGEGSNVGNGSGIGNAKDTGTPKQVERWKFTFNGTEIKGYTTEAGAESRIEQEYKKLLKEYLLTGKEKNGDAGFDRLMKANAIKAAALKSLTPYKSYSHGGIVDYTGLAIVHGSKSRPESFLNAEQTAQITEALHSNGKNSVLSEVRQAVSEIAAAAKALVMNETNNSSSINVAPGAVVVKVEKLNDKYDINSVADDIMNKMVSIASKATNRGVNRR